MARAFVEHEGGGEEQGERVGEVGEGEEGRPRPAGAGADEESGENHAGGGEELGPGEGEVFVEEGREREAGADEESGARRGAERAGEGDESGQKKGVEGDGDGAGEIHALVVGGPAALGGIGRVVGLVVAGDEDGGDDEREEGAAGSDGPLGAEIEGAVFAAVFAVVEVDGGAPRDEVVGRGGDHAGTQGIILAGLTEDGEIGHGGEVGTGDGGEVEGDEGGAVKVADAPQGARQREGGGGEAKPPEGGGEGRGEGGCA